MNHKIQSASPINPKRIFWVALSALTLAASLMLCGEARADLITPVVSSFSTALDAYGRTATKAVDGSGMSGPGYADDTANNNSANMWMAGGAFTGDHNPYIAFDLGAICYLHTTRIWQYNEVGFTQVSAKTVVISTSTDNVTFQPLSTNVLARAGGAWNEPAQDITTVAAGVRYVKIQILDTWDGAVFWNGGAGPNGADGRYLTGFSEVRFEQVFVPFITQQPQSQTIAFGSSANFTVAANDNGTPPLSYQWRKDGVNLSDDTHISGATTTNLTISSITIADAGNYDVIVSNPNGGTASTTAILSVNAIILPGAIQWDGNAANDLDGPAPFYTEGNLARRPGVTAIASDVLSGYATANLNDGIYGNNNAWVGNSASSWAGLNLGVLTHVTAFAFGRDNTAGGYTDRTAGNYRIQYTQSASVGAGSTWTDIGTISYNGSLTSTARRHQYTLNPAVDATGFRILSPAGACIDEIELYDTTPAALSSPWLSGGHFGPALAMGIRAPHWGAARLDSTYQQRPLTVEAWARLNSTADINVIVTAGFKQFSGCWLLGSDITTGNLFAYLPGSSPTTVNSGRSIVDGQWHYIAMVLEPARVRLYVDGVQRADAALSAGTLPASGSLPSNHPGELFIGAYPPDHQGCDGLVDELRISSQALSISGVPGTAFQAEASTVGLWHFDQFANGGFADSSVKANPAMLAPPPANPILSLHRGITLDRLYFGVQTNTMFTSTDITLIASMGFDHIKVLIDPATHKSGAGINPATMPTLKMNVDLAVSSGLPVVVDIHPQGDFKYAELGNAAEFDNYLGFMNAFAQYLASNYPTNQIAFEFMTEPFGNYTDWTLMQYRIWEAVRMAMPNHTLILSGDQTGRFFGVLGVHPVNDANVLYCFTTYDPGVFTMQGGGFAGDPIQYLRHVPYPSSPEIVNASLADILANVPSSSQAIAQQDMLLYGEQAWNANVLNARFKRLADWNQFFGGQLQLWCAEFGCLDPGLGGVKATDRWAFVTDIRRAFETNNIWWAYWSYNETFTVMLPGRIPGGPAPAARLKDQYMLNALGFPIVDIRTPTVASFSSQLVSPPGLLRYATNTVNGSGMSGPGTDGDTADLDANNQWMAGGVYTGDHNPYITFDLGKVYNLKTTRIWQYNEYQGSQLSAKTVVILTSPDDVNFTPLSTNTLAEATGWYGEPAQDIPSEATNVRYVEIKILETWDGAVFWNGGVGPDGADGRYLTGFAEVRFDVEYTPIITQQPQSLTKIANASAMFTVVATDNGYPPLSYQWRKNGVNLSNGGTISGALTASLSITNITVADAANYDVVVSNLNGTVTSHMAVLTVNNSGLLLPSVAGFSAEFSALGRYAVNTVNGSGMSGPGLVTDTADNNSANMWMAGGIYTGDYNPYITFDLGVLCNLQTTRIWQYNEVGNPGFSAKTIVVATSTDNVTFTPLSTNVLVEAGGTSAEPAQDLATVAHGVRYVKIQILDTWDGAVFWNGGVGPGGADGRYLTGLAEVRFVASALVNTSPCPITSRLTGASLNLSWPDDHLGWRLLVQTNQGNAGLSTNWFTWPNSTNWTSVTIPIVPSNPSVFFKVVYP